MFKLLHLNILGGIAKVLPGTQALLAVHLLKRTVTLSQVASVLSLSSNCTAECKRRSEWFALIEVTLELLNSISCLFLIKVHISPALALHRSRMQSEMVPHSGLALYYYDSRKY